MNQRLKALAKNMNKTWDDVIVQALTEFADSQGRNDYIGMLPGEFLSCRSALAAECGCGTDEECRQCGAVEAILAVAEEGWR